MFFFFFSSPKCDNYLWIPTRPYDEGASLIPILQTKDAQVQRGLVNFWKPSG